jgi:ribosomal-protein-alanine N-acetyltransferase
MEPGPPFVVRQATEQDLAGIAGLDARCFDPAWDEASWRAELDRPLSELLVAVHDRDGVLAYGLLWRVTDELHLQRLAADPARRRQGLARGLLEEAIARGRATGQRCLLLEVGASNEAALALYRSVGCAIVGRRSHYYTDGDDALLLTLELTA